MLETAKVVIQQAGRSTRGPEDWSTTIVLDPSFERLITRTSKYLPKSFLEAVKLHYKGDEK